MGVNVLALIVVDWMFDSVTIDGWWPLIIGAAVLGFANAILKPILAILTLPLIIITFGMAYFAINVADARARRVDRPGLLDRRLLDVRRRDDRRLARERRRRLAARASGEREHARVAASASSTSTGAGDDRVADGDVHRRHGGGERRGHRMLHLHRLERDERLSRRSPRPPADVDARSPFRASAR